MTAKGKKDVNPFDFLYGSVAFGLVQALGPLGKVFGSKKWKPGEKLEILFVAYSGARNTGAEVRVGECIKQINQILGEDQIEVNVLTLDKEETEEYYRGYKFNAVQFSSVFFSDVYKQVKANHLIVLVEGSCWKENFASALLLYFLYAAGLASKMDKPCFSYAVDAGNMNDFNNWLSKELSKDMTKIITRTKDAAEKLQEIGLPGAVTRVDTAWTQCAEPSEYARKVLMDKGWDGKKKLVGLAMQNYFWWPIVPDLAKYVKKITTGDKDLEKYNYKLVYFYDYSDKDKETYEEWAAMLTRVMDEITEKYDVQPVIIGMEALDKESCLDVQNRMKNKAIVTVCQDFIGDEMASILRELNVLITTRYHAMVLSMPGKIPFVGLSRDERIRGVMRETGLFDQYYLDYKEDNLEQKIKDRADKILSDPAEHERIRQVIDDNLPYYFAQMGMLGLDIRDLVKHEFPQFCLPASDENDVMNLIPHCPDFLVQRVKDKYLELKRSEGR
ncbi:MAG: polysaccharide pyruvyl transferase family protein [bacterium]